MSRHSTHLRPRLSAALPLALVLLAVSTAAGIRWTDFRQKGATNGWLVAGTAYSSDRGLKFAEPGAFAQRAELPGTVTSVVVVTYCSGARLDSPFTLEAGAAADRLVAREPPIAYVYTRYATNAFVFAAAEDVRAVRVRSNADGEVKGNYYLTAVGLAGTDEEAAETPPAGGETGDEEPSAAEPAAWRTSEFAGGTRREDFAWVLGVTKATPWENGVTVPGFHAFRNGVAVTSAGRDSGRATAAGLYASRAPDADLPRSLSLLGSSGSSVSLELHVLNDSSAPLTGARVAYDAHQWTFPGSEPRTLAFEWAATRTAARPADGDWRAVASAGFASCPAPAEGEACVTASRTASLAGAFVPAGGMLWLRWSVPRQTGSPMFGVGCVQVDLVWRRGTAFIVR